MPVFGNSRTVAVAPTESCESGISAFGDAGAGVGGIAAVERSAREKAKSGLKAALLFERAADLFDQDVTCGGVAEGDASAADLAEDGRGAGDLRDKSGFAEAHLADALAEIRVTGERAHAPGRTSGELTERDMGG